jgi:hypothetical protein
MTAEALSEEAGNRRTRVVVHGSNSFGDDDYTRRLCLADGPVTVTAMATIP